MQPYSPLPSSSPKLPDEEFVWIHKDLRFAALKGNIDEAIGIMTSIEGLPRNVKVYRDRESGQFSPSAKPVVEFIERMKSPDGSHPIRDTVLGAITWGSQVFARNVYRQSHQDTARDVQQMENEIAGSLLLIDEALEQNHLTPAELYDLKGVIEQLRDKLNFADLIVGIYKSNVKPEEKEKKTNLENVKPEIVKPKTKLETVQESVALFKEDLNSKIAETLQKLEAKFPQREESPSPTPALLTPPSYSPSPPPVLSEENLGMAEITPPSSPSVRSSEEMKDKQPLSPIPVLKMPEEVVRLEIEDTSQEVDISRELKNVKSVSANSREERALEAIELEGVNVKDLVQALSREGIYSLQCLVVNYWKVRLGHEKSLLAETDPRVKRLAPLRFNGKTLYETLDGMKTNQVIILKTCLVNYWYTYGIR